MTLDELWAQGTRIVRHKEWPAKDFMTLSQLGATKPDYMSSFGVRYHAKEQRSEFVGISLQDFDSAEFEKYLLTKDYIKLACGCYNDCIGHNEQGPVS